MSKEAKYELPEILYDEPKAGHEPNPFPFIVVKPGKKPPVALFIEIRTETGDSGPGPNGITETLYDGRMHKFVDLEILHKKLPPHLNNIVRVALGLQPLEVAIEQGEKILSKVEQNMNEALKEAEEHVKKNKGTKRK